jgi:uncharacterized membrane protein YgcG
MRAWAACFVLLNLAASVQAVELPPAPRGVVADGASLFSADERAKIEAFGADVLKKESISLRVLTLASSGGEDPKAIAVQALNTWRVGPDSVLLLIVMNPRALYLQPGKALASSFPAQASSAICSETVAPQMRLKAYGAAALAGLGAIRDRLTAPQVADAPPPPTQVVPASADSSGFLNSAATAVLQSSLLLFMGFAFWLRWKFFVKRCPQCQTRMGETTRVIRSATETTEGLREILYLCPACSFSETRSETIGLLGSDSSSSDSSSSSSSGSDSGSSDGSGGGGSSW